MGNEISRIRRLKAVTRFSQQLEAKRCERGIAANLRLQCTTLSTNQLQPRFGTGG